MKNVVNIMILNGIDIGISKIELNKSDLLIIDRSGKYCLKIYIRYNWKDVNNIKIGAKESIDFNEYVLAENNEPALIWPSVCNVEKISADSICFNLEFKDLQNTTHYMNNRGHFDIELHSLKINIYINYKDAVKNSIIYNLS